MNYLSQTAIKINTIWLMMLIVPIAAFANEKIEKIIEVSEFEEEIENALKSMTPLKFDTNEYIEESLADRHSSEQWTLYNQYFNWETIKPEIIISIKKTYTKEEIDAYYKFINSKHGSSFVKKRNRLETIFESALTKTYESYKHQKELMDARHEQEFQAYMTENKELFLANPEPPNKSKKTSLGDIVRFIITTEGGEMVGYKVRAGRNPNFYQQSPFKDGDLILSINGILLNKPNVVKDLYQHIEKHHQLHFEIKRNGGYVDFVIDTEDYKIEDSE